MLTFNHPIYARWLVRYHDNLLKFIKTHNDVCEKFQKSGFGIKRTRKDSSRFPINLTLGQTDYADASIQKTGILNFTNSIPARQRWADSNFLEWSFFQKFLLSLI